MNSVIHAGRGWRAASLCSAVVCTAVIGSSVRLVGQTVGQPDLVGKAVAEAKAQGRNVVAIPRLPIVPPPIVRSIDEAVGRFAIIVAVPESAAVRSLGFTLDTWYRLRVDEFLLRQARVLPAGPTPPPAFGTLGAGEIWLGVDGGDTVIDGISVTVPLCVWALPGTADGSLPRPVWAARTAIATIGPTDDRWPCQEIGPLR